MVRIKCVNPNCTSPSKSFEWDESKYVKPGGGIAQPHEPGTVRVIAVCPCGTENIVWVKQAKTDEEVMREYNE